MNPQEQTTSHFGSPVEKAWPTELDFLWLEVTSKCNLECVHCYADSGPGLPLTRGMSCDRWIDVLKEGFALGCRKTQFIGGEPTLYPHLLRLVKEAKNLGYEVIEVFTNGTLLRDKMLATFRDCNVALAFSLYSCRAEVHDAITCRKGSHTRTVESIRKVLRYRIPLRVSITVMKENVNDLEPTKEFLRELGVQCIGIDRMRGIGRANDVLRVDDPMGELCGACWRGLLTVDSRGDAFPCIMSRFHKVGNVSQSLQHILQNRELHAFRRKVREMDEVQSAHGSKCNPRCCPGRLICTPIYHQ